MKRKHSLLAALAACLVLVGCASVHNMPVNVPLHGNVADKLRIGIEDAAHTDEYLIGLSFSGGGTRAAAFSFGVLSEMDRVPLRGAAASMLDRIDFVSGVSGGSVTAAYFGLKKRAALRGFPRTFPAAQRRGGAADHAVAQHHRQGLRRRHQ